MLNGSPINIHKLNRLTHLPGREISILGIVPVASRATMQISPEIMLRCSLPVLSMNSTVRLKSRNV
jgi:hypothetical protein